MALGKTKKVKRLTKHVKKLIKRHGEAEVSAYFAHVIAGITAKRTLTSDAVAATAYVAPSEQADGSAKQPKKVKKAKGAIFSGVSA